MKPEEMRENLDGLLGDVRSLESIFVGWDETQRAAAQAYGRAIEALHGEALRRLVRALKADPAALAAMKSVASDEVVYAVLRRHEILRASLDERVEAALESIRPMLASHNGNVELVAIEPPSVTVRFTGSCDGCPASGATFHEGVTKAIQDACPEITSIVQAKGLGGGRSAIATADATPLISPFDLARNRGWRRAGELSQIPEGGVRAYDLDGRSLLLARVGASITCFDNACAHLGMPLDRGLVEGGMLRCPSHGFAYDLSTGECITAPQVQLTRHDVRIVGRDVEVRVSP
jgi:nitrite reductase/ring-hydroxylating ferredoxin subunit/Fe-S cluster biogenesis protein NfuA